MCWPRCTPRVGLDSVERVVKLVGFVASAEGFTGQPGVINGASDLMAEVFGRPGGMPGRRSGWPSCRWVLAGRGGGDRPGRMPEQHLVGIEPGGQLGEHVVARLPGGSLRAHSLCRHRDGRGDRLVDAEGAHLVGDPGGVVCRAVLELVVDGHPDDPHRLRARLEDGGGEQGQRVGAAGAGDEDRARRASARRSACRTPRRTAATDGCNAIGGSAVDPGEPRLRGEDLGLRSAGSPARPRPR